MCSVSAVFLFRIDWSHVGIAACGFQECSFFQRLRLHGSRLNTLAGFQVMVSDPGTSLSGCRVALLSCGQFDPPSYAHLRMFERARDFLVRTMGCKVVEGVMSVAGDSPSTRTAAKHRLRMVETAVRKNFWIRAGDYECTQPTPVRQIAVLKHYQKYFDVCL
ncbi:hypothetical protein ANCCAN_18689 [Ancylostoma caninum]|uniref:Cytidyltransferase-like domain-containing protein n=1 Tax=Ancylostoma caninum TaxID=29170 RepID=A0A368FXB1_ANCCA|nr:hypothetical protein ANCCAN_18689 [Ancylostoma caninum]